MLTESGSAPDVLGVLRWSIDEIVRMMAGAGKQAAAGLYVDNKIRFELQHAVGNAAAGLPVSLDLEAPSTRLPVARHRVTSHGHREPELPAMAVIGGRPRHTSTILEGPSGRYLISVVVPEAFDGAHIESLLNTLRTVFAVRSLQDRWRRSLRAASDIQRGLLPAGAPSVPGLEVAGRSVTAEEVGGDFYDYHSLDAGVLGVAIGDASGHGLPAALVARDVVVGLRMGMDGGMKMSRIFEGLNRVLHGGVPFSLFVSAFYAEVEPGGAVLYVNAGHPPPLCIGPEAVRPLAGNGSVLGPLPDARYGRMVDRLENDEVLVLYTDGIVERRGHGDEMFGEERLAQAVQEHLTAPVEDIVEAVFSETESFGRHLAWEDDATLVVLRRTAPDSSRGPSRH